MHSTIAKVLNFPPRAASAIKPAEAETETVLPQEEVRANPYSKIFHREGCEFGDLMSHVRKFTSAAKARSHGYRPCSVCRPTQPRVA